MIPSMHYREILHKFNKMDFPGGVAMFLDIDGTLLEIADCPKSVIVSAEVKTLISELECFLDGAIAFVSGRTIEEIDQLFAPLQLPTSGKHGLELRDSFGQTHKYVSGPSKQMMNIKNNLKSFSNKYPGTVLEDKTETVALHYRLSPKIENEALNLISRLLSNQEDLEVLIGKKVLEVRPKAAHKGTAISNFMQDGPFQGKIPIFIGDDTSDEDGFRAVNARGGISICVNPGPQSNARWRLKDVASVLSWLTNFVKKGQQLTNGYSL